MLNRMVLFLSLLSKTRDKAQQKVNCESMRLIGKKTFLEKRNSENMKGLF